MPKIPQASTTPAGTAPLYPGRQRGVARDNLDAVESGVAGRRLGCGDVARVEVDEPCADVVTAGVRRDYGNHVAPLSGAEADDAIGPGGRRSSASASRRRTTSSRARSGDSRS